MWMNVGTYLTKTSASIQGILTTAVELGEITPLMATQLIEGRNWSDDILSILFPIAVNAGYVLFGIKLLTGCYLLTYGKKTESYTEFKYAIMGFFLLNGVPKFMNLVREHSINAFR